MYGERGSLFVGFVIVIVVVGFGVSVNNMVFVEGGVFCESFIIVLYCIYIRFFFCFKKCYNYIIF